MSYQKLWFLFLPILLVNGLFTRGSCLIPYQISLCVDYKTNLEKSDAYKAITQYDSAPFKVKSMKYKPRKSFQELSHQGNE